MLISQLVCLQYYAKTTRSSFIEFGGKVAHGSRKNPLDFDVSLC